MLAAAGASVDRGWASMNELLLNKMVLVFLYHWSVRMKYNGAWSNVFLDRIRNHRTYPVTCRFQLFVALCDHNPPTLQTDGRTDGRHARSIGATCVDYGMSH